VIPYLLGLVFGWRAMLGGGEPAIHWTASYVDANGSHTVETWREPGHVRRITDRALELDAVRPRGDGYRFAINDRARSRTFYGTERDRILERSFDDWQRWTHAIAPRQPGGLVFALRRPDLVTRVGRCAWFTHAGAELCWSRALALPLVVRQDGKDVYLVTSAEPLRAAIPAFAPIGAELGRDDD
jgi:hypothetical protein